MTLTSSRLHSFMTSWRVLDDTDFASDHSALFSCLSTRPSADTKTHLNWKSVHWESFRLALQTELHSLLSDFSSINNATDLHHFAQLLTLGFGRVIDQHVPTRRLSWASNPWWSQDLDVLRHRLSRLRRRWQRTKTRADKSAVNACRK